MIETAAGPAQTLERGLELMLAIIRDASERPVSAIARDLGIPRSTASRMITTMIRQNIVMRTRRGHFAAGAAIASLLRPGSHQLLEHAARPTLRTLSRQWGLTAHVGVLDKGMVTYVAKEHGRNKPVFTREASQLEAYCSGLGKVLLAALGDEDLDAYLASDELVPLTKRTITEPEQFRLEIENVRSRDYAVDDEEVAVNLSCIAVPIRNMEKTVVAALSVSGPVSRIAGIQSRENVVEILRNAAANVSRRLSLKTVHTIFAKDSDFL